MPRDDTSPENQQQHPYSAEQIEVPPKLPMILKQFCKSAIRTQPYDLLRWSSAYFHALANGEEPPTKLRLEYPPICTAYGLTIGFLKVLLRQLGADYNKVLPLDTILARWDNLCLDRRDAELIVRIGRFSSRCQVKRFLAIGAGLLARSIAETMIIVCELFTHEPDGGSAMIPVGLFMEIYGYLAGLRCDGAEKGLSNECLCSDTTPTSIGVTADNGPDVATAGPASVASQDTEADIDLDFESLAKDDAPSGMTMQSFGEESDESFRHEGEASFRTTDRSDESKKSSGTVEKQKEVEEETYVKKESKTEIRTTESVSEDSIGTQQRTVSENTQQSSESSTHHPDVPGIGRRLLAEEVASVAIWMSECARRQGGMVGPRNVRHINCPPLEGRSCDPHQHHRD